MKYMYELVLRNGNTITVVSDLNYEEFIDHTLGSAAKFGGFTAREVVTSDSGDTSVTSEYKTAIRLSDIIQATPLGCVIPIKKDE